MYVYPGAAPEFRLLKKQNGVTVLQVRYINAEIGYIGKWQDIPVVEDETNTA
jgi:hypothetical protein